MGYLCMKSQVYRHPENFRIAASILFNIKKNNGKLDSDLGLGRDLLKLWIYTLIGTGHIRKVARDYVITEKGEDELRRYERRMLMAA
jgi:hypothetical protein